MKKIIALVILLNVITHASKLPNEAIIKIFASISKPSYKYPWQTSKIARYKGSGSIIKDNMILTSAHVVSGARFLEVQKENDPKKYIANVKYISHQADLAIIEVEDKKFFEKTKQLKLNTNIKPRDEITVLGYPLGGETISTTTGVVSRIEYRNYVWSGEYLLAVQVDAAINSGNSGGPAINSKGEIIGVAMMSLKKASNISYIVPSIIVNTFLEDIKDGVVHGFGDEGIYMSYIRNASMKKYFGLENDNGILVTEVSYDTENFKENDIIIEIDGNTVANDGTIKSKFGRVYANLIMSQKQIGDVVKFKVLRNKKVISFDHIIKRTEPLIKREFSKEPRYLIFGGLTFTPLTKNYISSISNKADSIEMMFYNKDRTNDFTEAVIWMQSIFPHNVNRGYSAGTYVVEKVNNTKVKNFKHFVSLIDNLDTKFVLIETLEKQKIILDVKEAKDSFKDLKKTYYLNSDRRVD